MGISISSSARCSLCTSLLPKHTLSLVCPMHKPTPSSLTSFLTQDHFPPSPDSLFHQHPKYSLHETRFLGPDSRAVRLLLLFNRTVVLCVPLHSAFCAGYARTVPCPSMSLCLHICCFSNAFTHPLLIIRIRFTVQISYHLIWTFFPRTIIKSLFPGFVLSEIKPLPRSTLSHNYWVCISLS